MSALRIWKNLLQRGLPWGGISLQRWPSKQADWSSRRSWWRGNFILLRNILCRQSSSVRWTVQSRTGFSVSLARTAEPEGSRNKIFYLQPPARILKVIISDPYLFDFNLHLKQGVSIPLSNPVLNYLFVFICLLKKDGFYVGSMSRF